MKNLKYILLLALLVVAGYFFFSNKKSTLKTEKTEFAVEDTASVTKIFMADQQGRKITLERLGKGQWKVNDKYLARQDGINILLETMKRLSIKSPVNKAAFENVVKQISVSGIKVEIYQGESKPSKVYYVGTSNQNHTGSYMLLENSTVPFLVHLEGFYGFLTPRYFVNENEWRDRSIFRYNYGEIQSIKVEHPQDDRNSFEIKEIEPNIFSLTNLATSETVTDVDTIRVLEYVSYYKIIPFEGLEETKTPEYIESIKEKTPMQIYTVTDKNGNVTKVKTYLKPLPEGATDPEGNEIFFDVDRLYADVNDKDFVVCQYLIFDKLDKKLVDFLK